MKGLDDDPTNSGNSASLTDKVTNGDTCTQKSTVNLLKGLHLCQEAWNPGSPWDRNGAHAALWGRPPGSFLVVPDSLSKNKLLCVSVGDQGKTVQDFPILCTGSALSITTSHLAFSDLLQLLTFYTISRDVLPLCLSVPSWVYNLIKRPDLHLVQLGPKAWLCPSSDLLPDTMTLGALNTQDTVMCSIQLTTASGALCIINPLYLQEHGDDWLTKSLTGSKLTPRPRPTRDRRLSSARPWAGVGLKKRAGSLEESSSSVGNSGSPEVHQSPVSPVTTSAVILRRSSTSSNPDPLNRVSADSLNSPLPLSPHRVSWIEDKEDKVWMNPPPPSSLLHLPCLELDSLSISSIEEELEAEPAINPSQSHQSPRQPLADKVKNRLSAVGQVLGGFICPQRKLSKRVHEMSERKGSSFADALKRFIDQTLKMKPVNGLTSIEMLQEARTSLSDLRETLYDYAEIQTTIDTLGDVSDFELDAMLELALQKVALKPLYSHLYECIKMSHQEDGSLKRLLENQRTLIGRNLDELEGTPGAGVPDAVMLEKIQQRWSTMHQDYSPQKKVETLLKVCKNIYHSMTVNAKAGVVFGADDFLPCLTWVLLRCDVVTLQIDTDYMMELLDPSQLQGEGGYYLTSIYAALFYISSFQPRLPARQLSAEAHQSLSQWHSRRSFYNNQTRFSRNRRTFRRTLHSKGAFKDSKDADAVSKAGNGNEMDLVVPETLQILKDSDDGESENCSTEHE